MPLDKRLYTRYDVFLEGIVAHEKGFNFKVELLDISVEGAKLKIPGIYPIKEGDELILVVKGSHSFKMKGTIKWIRVSKNDMEVGLQFHPLDMETSQALSEFLSSLALSSLSNIYLR
jgi:hypothetical protein